ncbi:MAG: hypothetical protein HF967_05455 [Methanosarcinales archaeon]|nr:hypothetical protein [Methanosarcinales archaeon]
MSKRNKPEDAWLMDSEVKVRISKVKGRWEVSLIFIDTKNPLNVLVKTIGDYRSQRLAEISAMYMQRTAAKDVRGTQKVNKDDYDINNN